MKRFRFNNLTVLIFLVLLSFISLKFFPLPWFWILILCLLSIGWAFAKCTKSSAQAIWTNIGAVALSLAVFEAYLWLTSVSIQTVENPSAYVSHEILGYALKKNTTVHAARYVDKDKIWEAVYTLNVHGIRVNPHSVSGVDSEHCLVFFGGSYTFGEGVNDSETFPAQVELQSSGKFKVFNFGVGGYGPHQMLALLENKLETDILNCHPQYAIYQGLPSHLRRVAGRAHWDKRGPRYEVDAAGQVHWTGSFNQITDKHDSTRVIGRLKATIVNQFEKSLIFSKIQEDPTHKIPLVDIDLYVGVVVKAKKIFEDRYPGAKFLLLFWDIQDLEHFPILSKKFLQRGIRIFLISKILQGENRDWMIHRYETHPIPAAYRLMARYTLEHMLRDRSSSLSNSFMMTS